MFRFIAIIAIVIAAGIVFLRLGGGAASAGPSPMRPTARRWQRFIWLMMLIGAGIAAITGIGSKIISVHEPIGGWTLILHCLAAPLFAIGIALIALLWAGAYMRTCVGGCSFWCMLTSGMIAIFSIAFTMTPLFGDGNQHFLISVHRWSSLVLVFFMALHAARVAAAMRAQRQAGA